MISVLRETRHLNLPPILFFFTQCFHKFSFFSLLIMLDIILTAPTEIVVFYHLKRVEFFFLVWTCFENVSELDLKSRCLFDALQSLANGIYIRWVSPWLRLTSGCQSGRGGTRFRFRFRRGQIGITSRTVTFGGRWYSVKKRFFFKYEFLSNIWEKKYSISTKCKTEYYSV